MQKITYDAVGRERCPNGRTLIVIGHPNTNKKDIREYKTEKEFLYSVKIALSLGYDVTIYDTYGYMHDLIHKN